MISNVNFSAKRVAVKQWEAEWGKTDTERNIWWLGSAKANWEAVMGKNRLWWFCKASNFCVSKLSNADTCFLRQVPVGRSESDGSSYPINPRFDKDGRLMPRKEWPADLQ
jgi:palmitoyltransferase